MDYISHNCYPGSILLKLAIDPSRREPAKVLRAEFEGSVGKLLPLLERIRQTDDLIDAVVYGLYGLTEEEKAIVEEKRSQNRIFCSNKRHCPMSKQLLQGPPGEYSLNYKN